MSSQSWFYCSLHCKYPILPHPKATQSCDLIYISLNHHTTITLKKKKNVLLHEVILAYLFLYTLQFWYIWVGHLNDRRQQVMSKYQSLPILSSKKSFIAIQIWTHNLRSAGCAVSHGRSESRYRKILSEQEIIRKSK